MADERAATRPSGTSPDLASGAHIRPSWRHKSAEYLRDRSGLDAADTDIYELIKRSVLRPVGSYNGWDTFDLNDIDDLI